MRAICGSRRGKEDGLGESKFGEIGGDGSVEFHGEGM